FFNRDMLFIHIQYKHEIRYTTHLTNTAQRSLQIIALAGEFEDFFLGETKSFLRKTIFIIIEAMNRLRDRLPVGQHTAKPAMIHIVLATAFSVIGNAIGCLLFRAYKENAPTAFNNIVNRLQRIAEHWDCLFQVDDMNAIALTKDIRLHLGVPTTGM